MKLPKIIFAVGGIFALLFFQTEQIFSQKTLVETANFRQIVEGKLKTNFNTTLDKICPIETDATARRIFSEYGAIFISSGTALPGKCIFTSESEVRSFQTKSNSQTANIGGIQITLQNSAMQALLEATQDAAQKNLKITPRGGSLAAGRSYQNTVDLWNSRFYPALNYWVGQKKISRDEAEIAKKLSIREQTTQVLEWEKRNLYFSKDLTKSILFSVAAPGASQHNFLLALDVQQFADARIRKILADHGWFQTVKSDLPHFTYLGVKESELPALGLKPLEVGGQKFWIPNLEP